MREIVYSTGQSRKVRSAALLVVALGCLLWFIFMGPLLGTIQLVVPVLGPLLSSSFHRYAVSAVGVLLIASGAALFAVSFDWTYLTCFLAFGLLAGVPVSVVAFESFSTMFAGMVEVGEASILTFLYLALIAEFPYGLFGGIIGLLVCWVWKTRNGDGLPRAGIRSSCEEQVNNTELINNSS